MRIKKTALQKGYNFVEDAVVARRNNVTASRIWQPQIIVGAQGPDTTA